MALETSKQNRFARLLNSRKRRDHYNEINDQPADINEAMAGGAERSQEVNQQPPNIERAMVEGARRSQEVNNSAGTSDVYSDQANTNQNSELDQKRQLDANKQQDKNQLKLRAKGNDSSDQEAEPKVAFNKPTGQLLKQSWLNLIDSFGLTLLWIHTHALLSKVFAGKVFGPLGSEWVPQEIINKGGDELRAKIKKFGLIEWVILLFIDFILFLVILFIIGLLGMIAYYAFHPAAALWDLGLETAKLMWKLL